MQSSSRTCCEALPSDRRMMMCHAFRTNRPQCGSATAVHSHHHHQASCHPAATPSRVVHRQCHYADASCCRQSLEPLLKTQLRNLCIAKLIKNLIPRTIMHAKPFGADLSMKNRTTVPKAASPQNDVSSQQRERRVPQLDSLLERSLPPPPPSRSQTLSSVPHLTSDISISSASRLSGRSPAYSNAPTRPLAIVTSPAGVLSAVAQPLSSSTVKAQQILRLPELSRFPASRQRSSDTALELSALTTSLPQSSAFNAQSYAKDILQSRVLSPPRSDSKSPGRPLATSMPSPTSSMPVVAGNADMSSTFELSRQQIVGDMQTPPVPETLDERSVGKPKASLAPGPKRDTGQRQVAAAPAIHQENVGGMQTSPVPETLDESVGKPKALLAPGPKRDTGQRQVAAAPAIHQENVGDMQTSPVPETLDESVGKPKASLAFNTLNLSVGLSPNTLNPSLGHPAPSSFFLNHDEHILQVIMSDATNPIAHLSMEQFKLSWKNLKRLIFKLISWPLTFFFTLLVQLCCCQRRDMGKETIKNVLILTNQRLIKFKESTGSKNGDFPRRCAPPSMS
jgi:hypothetical protein